MLSELTPQQKREIVKSNIYNSYYPLDNNDLEKGKKVPIGTISSKTGLKKVAEGKWAKVTDNKVNNTTQSEKDSDELSVENEPIIGKTKSGKTVYRYLTAGHPVYKDFTHKDHSEASVLHYSKMAPDDYDSNTGFQQAAMHVRAAKTHDKIANKMLLAEIDAMRKSMKKSTKKS